MDCELAINLLSARLDGEIPADELAGLDAHLQACSSCRATAEAFQLQDGELQGAFEPYRQAAAALAEIVVQRLPSRSAIKVPATPRWWALAIAALVVIGVTALLLSQMGPSSSERSHQAQGKPAEPLPNDILVPRPRPRPPESARMAVGQSLETEPAQKRLVELPDHSLLLVNQNSKLKLDQDRHITLEKGEVYLEVAPRDQDSAAATFVVKTGDREVSAHGTKFDVRSAAGKTDVVVTQGKVQVSGIDDFIGAGQRLDPDTGKPTAAMRASCALDWTRELLEQSETPLVPSSKFAGGALIAVDANGQQANLSLRNFHVDVHIEDGFARTTIDQTYFNHTPWRLEGTFYFPLPADASLNRLAMYVNGTLMEGGMAERDYARQVYDRIKSTMRDPALLEWVDGTTFKMRVFPLEGRQEKRIVLSYVQRLPVNYGQTQYRFPAGHSLQVVDHWSFHALVKNGAHLVAGSPSHPDMKIQKDAHDLTLDSAATAAAVNRDVVLNLTDVGTLPQPFEGRFTTHEQDGWRYLMLRYRPALPPSKPRQRRDWVFLFESSADRDPLLARVQVEVIRHLLSHAEADDTFTIVTAGSRVHTFAEKLRPVNAANVTAAMEFLDHTHLIGALDLGAAFDKAASIIQGERGRVSAPSAGSPNFTIVHLGAGLPSMGDRREDGLIERIPKGARYVGIGVGKQWSRSLMKRAAEKTGGYFTQINPDESVAWRGFELMSILISPRLLDVKVTDPVGKEFLTIASAVSHGEEICALTRIDANAPLPPVVHITGNVDGRPFKHSIPVKDSVGPAGYLPRIWARLEIDRLLAEDAQKNKDRIIELSKAMYVMSPYTSLLVLENEAMYEEFKVDRGRKDHWAMYPCPEKIKVVYEPLSDGPIDVRNAPRVEGEKPHPNVVQRTVVKRGEGGFPRAVFTAAMRGRSNDAALRTRLDSPRIYAPDPMWIGAGVEVSRQRPPDDAMPGPPILGKIPYLDRLFPASSEVAGRSAATKAHLLSRYGGSNNTAVRLDGSSDPIHFGLDFLSNPRPTDKFGTDRAGDGGGRGTAMTAHLLEQIKQNSGQETAAYAYNTRDSLGRNARGTTPFAPASNQLGYYGPAGVLRVKGPEWLRRRYNAPEEWIARYRRPASSLDPSSFSDLLAYAAGMNTTDADFQAVIEDEAAPNLSTLPGHIDPEARKLIDQARSAEWQEVSLLDTDGTASLTIFSNGTGSFHYERRLFLGLREQVHCDGSTLLHLYPELGIGARRVVSRFHRAELVELVPWILPPADDLAHGADVRFLDEHTVAIVPVDAEKARDGQGDVLPYLALHLVIRDGSLRERQLIEMPARKVVLREVYEREAVRWLDGDGKEIGARKFKITPLKEAHSASPAIADLVILPLPWRSRDKVYPAFELNPNRPLRSDENLCYQYLQGEPALQLLAAELAGGDGAADVFRHCFHAHGIHKLGFFTLLAAAGINVAELPEFLEHIEEFKAQPLAHYLFLATSPTYRDLQQRFDLGVGAAVGERDSFLQQLAEFRALHLRWQLDPRSNWYHLATGKREAATFDFIHRHKDSVLGYLLLSEVQSHAGDDKQLHRRLADTWALLADRPGLEYVAAYEQARCLYLAGQLTEAANHFRRLFEKTVKANRFPAIDRDFRRALDRSDSSWADLMLRTADAWIQEKQRPAVIALAWRARELDDAPLANVLLDRALDNITDDDERLETHLAAAACLRRYDCRGEALALVEDLLARGKFAAAPRLWRLGSTLADEAQQQNRAIACLEKALDLEYHDLPDVIDLEQVRTDYRKLLEHYRSLVDSSKLLKDAARVSEVPLPRDLLARVVRAADRWRALDRDSEEPFGLAASILGKLGASDLAWDYFTSKCVVKYGQAGSWYDVAKELVKSGDLMMAERAFAEAGQADPADLEIQWDRAANLDRMKQHDEATRVLKQLVATHPAHREKEWFRWWAQRELQRR